jgi:RsiW-degrading membrane proteinase PrsW (M82 family)
LRRLLADAHCEREIDPDLLYVGARTLGDRWLMAKYLVAAKWKGWSQSLHVPLALFSAVVWYLILVRSASQERFRWWRYLSPVFAGVVSVWILQWAQTTFHYSMPEDREGDPVREFVQYFIHVGVPEEAVKLLTFALFVPLLVRHGSQAKAALTAGCVGLGFAMCENVGYYHHFGAGAAVGRLVLANFMHIAMTGLIGVWFYEMIRTRFHRAGEFVVVFMAVALAHGGYDFAGTLWSMTQGIDFVGIIILAVLARTYLHHLHAEVISVPRAAVGNTATLMLGLASVVGVAILISVWEADTMKAVTTVLKGTLAIIPICVFYVREFRDV